MSIYKTPSNSSYFDVTSRVMVVYSLPDSKGGMYEYLLMWLYKFKKEKKEIALVASDKICEGLNIDVIKYPSKEFVFNNFNGYRYACFLSLFGIGKVSSFNKCIDIAINDYMPDIIYMPDLTLYTDKIIKNMLRYNNIPILFTLHEPVPTNHKINLISFMWRELVHKKLFYMLRYYDAFYIHVHSKSLLSAKQNKYINKIIEISHPLPETITKRKRPYWVLDKEQKNFRIGFLGRIEAYKGLNVLYDAIKIVKNKNKTTNVDKVLEVVIAGKGDLDVEKWKELSDKIYIKNYYLSRDEFHDEIVNFDLLVLPYVEATQSGVAAMAVAYGIPMIASDVGEIYKFIDNGFNGFLVAPNNACELAEKISKLLVDDSLYLMLLKNSISISNYD